MFHEELIDAMKLVQRGAISTDTKGAWAGEIGQTQFMPSVYLRYAVSYNGSQNADLIGNSADALASTANFLKKHGWKRGAGVARGRAELRRAARMERRAGVRWHDRFVCGPFVAVKFGRRCSRGRRPRRRGLAGTRKLWRLATAAVSDRGYSAPRSGLRAGPLHVLTQAIF